MSVTAKKSSRLGTRYSYPGGHVTFWLTGRGFMVRIVNSAWSKARYEFSKTRADAAYVAGEWADPEQGGRFILDNDTAHLDAREAAE